MVSGCGDRVVLCGCDLRGPRPLVSLFCGIGGDCLGWASEGGEVLLAVDCWPEALAVHRHNLDSPTLCLMLGPETQAELEAAIIEATTCPVCGGRVEFHLHGSPPCQGVSKANPTSNAENGTLAANLADGLQLVRWFIHFAQNCSGAASWSMEEVETVARQLGPIPYTILDAADFGLPQTRRRVWAGVGWQTTPTHHADSVITDDRWRAWSDALPHLLDLHTNPDAVVLPIGRRVGVMKSGTPGRYLGPIHRDHRQPAATVCGGRRAVVSIKPEAIPEGHHLREGLRMVGGYLKVRSLTIEEVSTLQGFPDWFEFPNHCTPRALCKSEDAWKMVGNAVPPPVMAAVARGLLPDSATLRGWV